VRDAWSLVDIIITVITYVVADMLAS